MSDLEVYCPTCNALCNEFNDLLYRDNVRVHRVCGKIPITRRKGWKPRTYDGEDKQESFPCVMCGEELPTRKELMNHTENAHD